jgi:hypothetical protein
MGSFDPASAGDEKPQDRLRAGSAAPARSPSQCLNEKELNHLAHGSWR